MLVQKIEALLFVSGEEGIRMNELSHLTQETTANVYQAVEELKEKYDIDTSSALTILEVGDRFMMTTKKKMAELLKHYAQSSVNQKLSRIALETLAIIAYKQPITRSEIEQIRGVQSSGSIQRLVHKQLIEEKGRVEGPGRAILYGTTAYFFDYFGLKSMDDLPDIHELGEELDEDNESTNLFFDRFKEQFDEKKEE
ncbi:MULTISPECIES: SMC-Scp complex subunit ScpB [Enterococcaceae]|uniref:SMC-Scp complex subunit ScpB n=1 Tax=Enterococcaceae TaxID=81852 RepID=UPI000E4C3B8C|nr:MULTISPECIES: SMC-Scp complex subunit ScpB [Enterococcaceae]MCI0129611.1 SMC-Scp complex subunit ScpB [Vagococcus sp. CY53-2]RGI31777.1 SMC-Scp complex subunit ScpB [Melissococcus sp. OM08-11BH]UNM90256.1 SMC-Scp complex subunit ScpB [Vagococcus sp. CY52-2]